MTLPFTGNEHDEKIATINLNTVKYVTNACNIAIQRNKYADLRPVLGRHLRQYSNTLARCADLRHSSDNINGGRQLARPKGTHLLPMANNNSANHPPAEAETLNNLEIIYPLDSEVQTVLENMQCKNLLDDRTPALVQQIEAAIEAGDQLHRSHPGKVTRIRPDVVVKKSLGNGTEAMALNHVHQCSDTDFVPQLLGEVRYGETDYTFMSFVPGANLQQVWGELSLNEKQAVQGQLTIFFKALRSLPLPVAGTLGCGRPTRCIDVRTCMRESSEPIRNEKQFNSFLLSNPRQKISKTHLRHLESHCLKTDHQIVMTHGDLAPRNIIVHRGETEVCVAAIVDWECSGAYPEYWEYVKALNTVGSTNEDDCADYLPVEAIGQHGDAWAVSLVIERATR